VNFPRATRQHRLFSFITMNWRAKPLVSYQVIVGLIGATTTEAGLKVVCELDDNLHPKGITVSDEELAALNIVRAGFHGDGTTPSSRPIAQTERLLRDRPQYTTGPVISNAIRR
jgi:hypothetical protein